MEPQTQPSSKASRAVLAIVIIVAILAIGGVVAALMMNRDTAAPSTTQNDTTGDTGPSTTTQPAPNDESASTESQTATITFSDDGFTPSTLTVKKGAKVTVQNNSSKSVQFSSANHPTHTENPEMNLRTLAPGESASYTASTVGTHGYHDHIDESKTGKVIVTE